MKRELSRRRVIGLISGAALGLTLPARATAQGLRGAIDPGIDATHEGLTPGSPDDQSEALAQALAKADADGRPLFLPPGQYELANIVLPSNSHLVGVPGQSRLRFRGGSTLLRSRHANMLRLNGLTLDGDALPLDPNIGLLDAEDVSEVALDDCTFVGSGAAGARLRDCGGHVENCRFTTVGTIGLWLDQSRGMRVSGNAFDDCGDTGVLVSRDSESEDGSIVSGNRVTRVHANSGGAGQNGNGINLDKASGVVVSDNRIDDCAFSAIRCFSSDNVSVTDNVCTRSGEMALYVEFAFEGAIVANNLIDGGNGGISFANFFEHGGRLGVCSGNVVRNIRGGPTYPDGNLQIGAGIAAEADVAISGNIVEDAVWGLQLGWGPYLRSVTATGNVIRRTKIGIAVSVVEGDGSAVISDNLIADAKFGAILGTRWDQIATDDLTGSEAPPPNVTLSGNRRA